MTSCPGVLGTDLNVWKSIYEKIALLMFKTRVEQEGRALLYFSVCSEKLERLLHLQVRFHGRNVHGLLHDER